MALNTLDIYVVRPKEATNLVTNPSVEKATTGYASVNSTAGRVTTDQRRGAYSLEITPSTGVEAGAYFGTVSLTSGRTYTFSADVRGVLGQTMKIQFRDTSGNVLATQSFTANGYWQRVNVSWAEISTTTRRLYVVRDAVASTAKFYLDGFQVEEGSESTYFDGDMKGYTYNRVDFRWVGAPHTSASWRSGLTRKGGELVNIKTVCNVLGIIGLGMMALAPQALETTLPGSLYQRTSINDRDFSIAVKFIGENFRDIIVDRKTLVDLIRPDAGAEDQPLTLMIDVLDDAGSQVSERVKIAAHYTGGLEMKISENQRREAVSLNFRAFLPFITSDGERSVEISATTALTANSMIKRGSNGVWSNAGQTGTISGGGGINAIVRGPDGNIYFGGMFQNFNGVAAIDHIGKWDGNAFSALGSGIAGIDPDHAVRTIALGPDGKLYVGGKWTSAGGVANTANLAAWNGTAWESVAIVNERVDRIVFTTDGSMFITGSFTTVAGITCNRVAKRNPAGTWGAVGTGITTAGNYPLDMIAIGNDIYLCGNISSISGVTVYDIAKYSGTTWTSVGTGTQGGSTPAVGDLSISALLYDQRTQRLYMAGAFDKFNGVSVEGFGYWNGTAFTPLATNLGTNTKWDTNKWLYIDESGGIYVSSDEYLNGVALADDLAYYFGGSLVSPPISFGGSGKKIQSIFIDAVNEEIWVGINSNSSTTVYVNGSSTGSVSSARSHPKFVITGPGSLWEIKNYTTRQGIGFSGLTLLAGEVATLDLTPGQISFVSTLRGNIMRYIVPGSNLDLFLQTGTNNVSAFMTGTSGSSQILMIWNDTYWSLDGAVR